MGSLPRRASGLLALILAAAPAGAAADVPSPAAIAAANGHPARAHLRRTGSLEREGVRVAVTVETDGARRLERACIGPSCTGAWFDGRTRAPFGPNETPLPDDADDLPEIRTTNAIASLEWAEPEFGAAGGTVRALAPDENGDRYEIRAPGGAPLIALIDPATLRPRGIERNGRAVPLGDDRLGTPERLAGRLEAPRGAVPQLDGTAPIALRETAIPVVGCRIGGLAARCLLDTGTTPSSMTLAFAERLHLEPQGELELLGFTRGLTGIVTPGDVAIGPARWNGVHFAVASLGSDLGFDVVIGDDLLANLRTTLDPAGKTVRFERTAATPSLAVPISFHLGLPYAPLALRGHERPALIDTGDEGVVSIGYDDFRRELADLPVTNRQTTRGIGGGSDAFVVDVEARAFGSDLGSVALRVTRTQHGAHLGWAVARRCARGLVIDGPARRAGCAVAAT